MKYTKHQIKDVTKSELESMIDEHIIGFKADRNRQLMKRRLCEEADNKEKISQDEIIELLKKGNKGVC